MNNYETYKARLNKKDRELLESDDFTFYAMDILIFGNGEIDIKELSIYLKTYKKLLKRNRHNQFIAYKILFPFNDFLRFLHLPFIFTYEAHNKNIYFRIQVQKPQFYKTIYKKELFKIPVLKLS